MKSIVVLFVSTVASIAAAHAAVPVHKTALKPAATDLSYLGDIASFPGNYCPVDWALADGASLQIANNPDLYKLYGIQFGGDGAATFDLPDLRQSDLVSVGTSGQGVPILWCVKLAGTPPPPAPPLKAHAIRTTLPGTPAAGTFSFLGDIAAFPSGSCPPQWHAADGTLIESEMNQGLASLIGSRFGGSRGHIALPNLQSSYMTAPGPAGSVSIPWCISLVGPYPPRHPVSHATAVTRPTAQHAAETKNGIQKLESPTSFIGSVNPFPQACPLGWTLADGTAYAVSQYPALANVLGARFGGEGTPPTFAVPDLRAQDLQTTTARIAWCIDYNGYAPTAKPKRR